MSTSMNMTDQYLMELHLKGVRESLSSRIKEALDGDLSFDDFLNLILFDEVQYRRNIRRQRLIKAAGFRSQASMEGLDYSKSRNLDKKLIQEISKMRFLDDGLNIMIFGATGVGKTYLATAIGNFLCRNGKTALFIKVNLLFEKIALVRAQGTYLNFLKKIRAVDLLIIDDFGLKPLTDQQFQDFYDVLDERDNGKSTIMTTQLPCENWDEVIKDPLVCEAVTDRLTSKAIKITLKGPSKRKDEIKGLTAVDKPEN